jgi:hypothetical protein
MKDIGFFSIAKRNLSAMLKIRMEIKAVDGAGTGMASRGTWDLGGLPKKGGAGRVIARERGHPARKEPRSAIGSIF